MTPTDVDTVLDLVLDQDDIGLVDAWPRVCGCGRSYTAHEWRLLAFAGTMVDDVESLELRNCECGSTLAQVIDDACAPTQRPIPPV